MKLFEPCLDPDESDRDLSMFDKLDVRRWHPATSMASAATSTISGPWMTGVHKG
jgi:hypothetical protein